MNTVPHYFIACLEPNQKQINEWLNVQIYLPGSFYSNKSNWNADCHMQPCCSRLLFDEKCKIWNPNYIKKFEWSASHSVKFVDIYIYR